MSEVLENFVTEEEVIKITGYKRPHEQKKWLQAHGWTFEPDSAGRPVIHRQVMKMRYGVPIENGQPDKEQEIILDLSKVK